MLKAKYAFWRNMKIFHLYQTKLPVYTVYVPSFKS